MKHSGIEWIGEIPKEWKLVPTKRLFSCKKQIAGENAVDYERLALTMQGVIKRDKEDNEGLQPEKFDGYQILKRNEIVFKLIDLANVKTSRVGLSPYLGIVSPAYIIIRNNSEDNRYFYYWFMFMYHQNIFNQMGDDGVRSSLNADDVLKIPIANISLSEQQKIAEYLDKVCRDVDEMIALQEQMIEELKAYKQSVITEAVTKGLNPDVPMKDSGIDWIGEIPEHWKVSRLKYFSIFINGFAFSSDVFTMGIGCKVIRIGDISRSLDLDGCVRANIKTDALQSYRIKNNDIVIAMSGATTGKCCIAKDVDEAYINQRVGIIRCDNYSYVYYSLQTDYFLEYINLNNAGSAQPNVSGVSIGNFPLLVPSLDEQQSIASYLDTKCAEIDTLIAIKQAKIEELKEYKKSVIYEYVTGKKEVE